MATAPSPEALARLAEYVERRIAELGLQYAEVARNAGFSDQTLIAIRGGTKVRSTTYRKLEKALFWSSGSAQKILDGGAPAPTDTPLAGTEVAEAHHGHVTTAGSTAASPREQELALAKRLLAATIVELKLQPDEVEEVWRRVRLEIEATHRSHEGDASGNDRNDRAG